jgi:hypothetical protein
MGSAANASKIVPIAGSSSAAAITLTVDDFMLPSMRHRWFDEAPAIRTGRELINAA